MGLGGAVFYPETGCAKILTVIINYLFRNTGYRGQDSRRGDNAPKGLPAFPIGKGELRLLVLTDAIGGGNNYARACPSSSQS